MALLTWIAVWPTSIFVSQILEPALLRSVPHVLAVGAAAAIVVAILFWVAMPLLTSSPAGVKETKDQATKRGIMFAYARVLGARMIGKVTAHHRH